MMKLIQYFFVLNGLRMAFIIPTQISPYSDQIYQRPFQEPLIQPDYYNMPSYYSQPEYMPIPFEQNVRLLGANDAARNLLSTNQNAAISSVSSHGQRQRKSNEETGKREEEIKKNTLDAIKDKMGKIQPIKAPQRQLSLVQTQQDNTQDRKTLSLLDNRKRALLWILSSFLQILKTSKINSIDQIKNQFHSYFKSDEHYFQDNFLNLFERNYSSQQHIFDFSHIENDLAYKVMQMQIPDNIQFIQNVMNKNNQQTTQVETPNNPTSEFITQVNLLQQLVIAKEKIMSNPSQVNFIILSMNNPSIKNPVQFKETFQKTQANVLAFIKYYKTLDYQNKDSELSYNYDVAINLMKRIEHENYGIFFLKYFDAYQEFDTYKLNERQRNELFTTITKLRGETTPEEYYETLFKVLQKVPQLGERKFGDKYNLTPKAVFLQFFENIVTQSKFKYLIEYYFQDFFLKYEKLLAIYFGEDYDDIIVFDYEKFLSFLYTKLNDKKFINMNKLFDFIYNNSVSFYNNDEEQMTDRINQFLKLNLNIFLQMFYPYLMVKDLSRYQSQTKNYKIPNNLNPRNQLNYTQNDQQVIDEKSKIIENPQTSHELLNFAQNFLQNLKTSEDIESFRKSPSYNQIYPILEKYFGQNFLDTNSPDFFPKDSENQSGEGQDQSDEGQEGEEVENHPFEVIYKKKIGPEVRLANLILHSFQGFDYNQIQELIDIIHDFNSSQKLDPDQHNQINQQLANHPRIEGKLRTLFSDQQYKIIKAFWINLIAKYSQKCYIRLFGKLTKRVTDMHNEGRLNTTTQLTKYLTNLVAFLGTDKPYDFSEKCSEKNDEYEDIILKNNPPLINKVPTEKEKDTSAPESQIGTEQNRKGKKGPNDSGFELSSEEDSSGTNKGFPKKTEVPQEIKQPSSKQVPSQEVEIPSKAPSIKQPSDQLKEEGSLSMANRLRKPPTQKSEVSLDDSEEGSLKKFGTKTFTLDNNKKIMNPDLSIKNPGINKIIPDKPKETDQPSEQQIRDPRIPSGPASDTKINSRDQQKETVTDRPTLPPSNGENSRDRLKTTSIDGVEKVSSVTTKVSRVSEHSSDSRDEEVPGTSTDNKKKTSKEEEIPSHMKQKAQMSNNFFSLLNNQRFENLDLSFKNHRQSLNESHRTGTSTYENTGFDLDLGEEEEESVKENPSKNPKPSIHKEESVTDSIKDSPRDQPSKVDSIKDSPQDQPSKVESIKDGPRDQPSEIESIEDVPQDHPSQIESNRDPSRKISESKPQPNESSVKPSEKTPTKTSSQQKPQIPDKPDSQEDQSEASVRTPPSNVPKSKLSKKQTTLKQPSPTQSKSKVKPSSKPSKEASSRPKTVDNPQSSDKEEVPRTESRKESSKKPSQSKSKKEDSSDEEDINKITNPPHNRSKIHTKKSSTKKISSRDERSIPQVNPPSQKSRRSDNSTRSSKREKLRSQPSKKKTTTPKQSSEKSVTSKLSKKSQGKHPRHRQQSEPSRTRTRTRSRPSRNKPHSSDNSREKSSSKKKMLDKLKSFNSDELKIKPKINEPPSSSKTRTKSSQDKSSSKKRSKSKAIKIPTIEPPMVIHKFSPRERKYLKNLSNAFYHSNQIKNSTSNKASLYKTVIFKKRRMGVMEKDFISKIIKKYPTDHHIKTLIKESSPMKDQLKKIIYKVVKKRICTKPKPKKDCDKKCFRIIDGIKYEIGPEDPHYEDLCKSKDEDSDDENLTEEYECDIYGNDISLMGSPGKKQVNMNPVFNINFVVENKKDLDNIKSWLSSAHMQQVIEPLSKDNVIDVEDLKKYVKEGDAQKKFTIDITPKAISAQDESDEQMDSENESFGDKDDLSDMLF